MLQQQGTKQEIFRHLNFEKGVVGAEIKILMVSDFVDRIPKLSAQMYIWITHAQTQRMHHALT